VIEVLYENDHNRRELYLIHRQYGVDLEIPYAKATLENLQRVWKRPVNLRTIIKGEHQILTWDGSEHTREKISIDAGI
jgi:stage V sporulation protein R